MRRNKRAAAVKTPGVQTGAFAVARAGEWISPEELRAWALRVASGQAEPVVDLREVRYLDAAPLQVLLALGAEEKKQGRTLQLMNLSPEMTAWFRYAGAAEHLCSGDGGACV